MKYFKVNLKISSSICLLMIVTKPESASKGREEIEEATDAK